MRSPRLRLLAAVFSLVAPAGLAGCGGEPAPPPDQPAQFPVTIDVDGTPVEIPARPERIVVLSPTATEMLFAIGAGDQVIAVDSDSDYPPEAPTTDLNFFEPNLEAVAGYQPDLVVAAIDPTGDVLAGLARLEIPTLLLTAASTLDDTYRQLAQLGAATGHVAEAAAVVSRMRTEIAAIVDGLPERPEPLTYYHELDTEYYTVTSETFIGQLYGLLGMRSIADDAGSDTMFPQLSAEFILSADPDVILLATVQCCGVDAEAVASRPGWDRLTAVREGRIIELDDDLASRWGPRVVDFLRAIAASI